MILYNRMYERIYLNLTNTYCKKENFLLYKEAVYKPPYTGILWQRNLLWNLSVTTPALNVPVNYSIRALNYNGNSFWRFQYGVEVLPVCLYTVFLK